MKHKIIFLTIITIFIANNMFAQNFIENVVIDTLELSDDIINPTSIYSVNGEYFIRTENNDYTINYNFQTNEVTYTLDNTWDSYQFGEDNVANYYESGFRLRKVLPDNTTIDIITGSSTGFGYTQTPNDIDYFWTYADDIYTVQEGGNSTMFFDSGEEDVRIISNNGENLFIFTKLNFEINVHQYQIDGTLVESGIIDDINDVNAAKHLDENIIISTQNGLICDIVDYANNQIFFTTDYHYFNNLAVGNNEYGNLIFALSPATNFLILMHEYIPRTENDILTFSFPEQTSNATINSTNHTVNIEVTNGTSLTNLVATFTLSEMATAFIETTEQTSETTENDFTNPVTYTIVAENEEEQDWIITVSVATSAKQLSADKTSIFPNPTNGKINIKTSERIENITVLDISGKIIIETTNTEIDLSKQKTGTYFVKIETENGIFTEKIIIE